jgi:drug/metabolite transporter (DMT)-like permease
MILFFKALKNLEAIHVALSNFLIAFFALPIAAIWLKEELSILSILGGIMVLVSTIIITVWEYKQTSPKKMMNNAGVETITLNEAGKI